jgi:hypothetical protein
MVIYRLGDCSKGVQYKQWSVRYGRGKVGVSFQRKDM